MFRLGRFLRAVGNWWMIRKLNYLYRQDKCILQLHHAEASSPPRPATLEDAVLFAMDLKIRATASDKALAEFELAYLAMHEEAFGLVSAEDFGALRASSLQRDDSQGRAMVAYIDELLAARLVPAAQ